MTIFYTFSDDNHTVTAIRTDWDDFIVVKINYAHWMRNIIFETRLKADICSLNPRKTRSYILSFGHLSDKTVLLIKLYRTRTRKGVELNDRQKS